MPHFPVLESIHVNGYALYDGLKKDQKFSHSFVDGPNIILGINGLGKTTLLNILLRSMTGAFDVPIPKLGHGKRRLVSGDKHTFRRRVPDNAQNATAQVDFILGKKTISVTRSLYDLSLVSYSVDGIEVENDFSRKPQYEESYQVNVANYGGYTDFLDFVIILRYLVFFLEERASVFWEPYTQFEVLSILFFSTSDRIKYKKLLNDVLKTDSSFRNMRSSLHLFKQRREAQKQEAQDKVGDLAASTSTRSLEELKNSYNACVKEIEKSNEDRKLSRERVESLKFKIEVNESQLSSDIQNYLSDCFPDLDDRGEFLLSQIVSGRGCMVCGSSHKEDIQRVLNRVTEESCPLCEAPPEHMDVKPGKKANKTTLKNIETRRSEINKLRTQLNKARSSLTSSEDEYQKAWSLLHETNREIQIAERNVKAREGEVASNTDKAIQELSIEKEKEEQKLVALNAELDLLLKSYLPSVKKVSRQIRKSFDETIDAFMAEHSFLKGQNEVRPVGQAGQSHTFYEFALIMASGAFDGQEVRRVDDSAVSESQKEFVELAFRLALVAAVSKTEPAMLVMETPEASLDTVFMESAGYMLNTLSHKHNRVIASSNLSRERLVGAMLGVPLNKKKVGEGVVTVPQDHREQHILDLLNIAVPNAALKKHRRTYLQRYRESVFGDRDSK